MRPFCGGYIETAGIGRIKGENGRGGTRTLRALLYLGSRLDAAGLVGACRTVLFYTCEAAF
jgi:hypothetical protein